MLQDLTPNWLTEIAEGETVLVVMAASNLQLHMAGVAAAALLEGGQGIWGITHTLFLCVTYSKNGGSLSRENVNCRGT